MKRILVTGATGFVGRFLCPRLLSEGWDVRGTVLASEGTTSLVAGVEPTVIDPLGTDTPWRHALVNVDMIIHLAARVHIMADHVADPLTEFRKVNSAGTGQLAREAARAGVKRLIFISSIKVNGEESSIPYTEGLPAQPLDPYGISKWEAEQVLHQVAVDTGLEVVILRPPLVYGPGVKANFFRLFNIVRRGIPLPLGNVDNHRSLIYIGNLVDAIVTCCKHSKAAGQTYLVSDGEDISTPELIRRLATALGRPARLIPFPPFLMRLTGKLAGKSSAVDRLLGSLTVDSSKIRRELGWTPPYTMAQGLKATADWYLKRLNE
jgi:nucleoside-diphosphate-sugar epimerase